MKTSSVTVFKKNFVIQMILIAAVLSLDQICKALILKFGTIFDRKLGAIFLSLNPSINQNFAFSIPANPVFILVLVSVIFILLAGYWWHSLNNFAFRSSAGLAMIIGGSFGNILDRLRFSGVIDFVELGITGWTRTSFNFADVAIVVGAIIWFWARNKGHTGWRGGIY